MYRCTICATEWLATFSAPLHCPGCGSLAFNRLNREEGGITVNDKPVERRSVVTVRDVPAAGVHAAIASRLAGVSAQAARATVRTRLVGEGRESRLRQPDFEIDRLIARGGMGEVVAARQVSLDREIAMKRLPPDTDDNDARTRFLAEAVLTANLDHPGIVPIHELGIDQHNRPFYAMKRIRGESWSARYRRMTLDENLEVLMRVCDAIAFAHMRGVIHRDLKPENVMLGDFGEVLVVDWGLAVSLAELRQNTSAPPMACGTPAYMAPEQACGDYATIGPCSDVYLLGATLYEIITGTPPHPGVDARSSLIAAADNVIDPKPPTGELGDVALKAMATKPSDRFDDVRAFQAALRAYRSHTQSEALAGAAAIALERAQRNGTYEDFARAMYGYEEALTLWPGNAKARDGATKARTAYAEKAFASGDLDLAATLTANRQDSTFARRISVARARRASTRRRLRLLTVISAILLAATVITLGTAVVMAKWERTQVLRAMRERDAAERRLNSLENRQWRTVVMEEFTGDKLPIVLHPTQGAWMISNDELVARGPGTSTLMLDIGRHHGVRIHYDWVTQRPHQISLHDLGATDPNARDQFSIDFGGTCTVRSRGQILAQTPMLAPIPDLPQHLRIEWEGRVVQVLVDGRQVIRVELPQIDEAANTRMVMQAEPGAVFDNLQIERLGEQSP